MRNRILIHNATIITLDSSNSIFTGDVIIENGVIVSVDRSTTKRDFFSFDEVIEAEGKLLLPGFVQTHVHLCQTMFRGSGDDLALLDWLKQRIWPMEAAHTPASLHLSAQLGIAEMIRGGTTCALTMETVNHTEAVFSAAEESGFRATIGKCMMDLGEDVPDALMEETDESISESIKLLKRYNGICDGRIRYCFAPRFAISCTQGLLERTASLAHEHNVMIHTHASENKDEVAYVEKITGRRNIKYLHDVGISGSHVMLAHCVWLDEYELELIRHTSTNISHCPSSNLKLASGIAEIVEMLEKGISVSLGADATPCNNRLDMFTEMRTMALIQKVLHGSETLPAHQVLRIAISNGAKAMGLSEQIGSVEIGKHADLQIINLNKLHTSPHPDLISTLVYAAQSSDVQTVLIDGKIVMRDGVLLTLNEKKIIETANHQKGSFSANLT